MITNLTRQTILASKVVVARSPLARMKGLLGRSALASGEALVITQCNSIHMLFMKFPIDVIFCDKQNKIVGQCDGIRPFRFSPVFFNASYVVELPEGTLAFTQTRVGDQISL